MLSLVILVFLSFALVSCQPPVMNSGILLKCPNSDKSYPITRKNAQKSNYLKKVLENTRDIEIVIPGDDCSEGLPIVTVKTTDFNLGH
jgi:hypothetical protein